MELPGQQTLDRIFLPGELLERFEGYFFKIQFADPLIFGAELPIGQLQLAVDAGPHGATAGAAPGDDQFARRIGHVAVERVESEIVVARVLAVEVSLERWAIGGPDNSSIPLQRAIDEDLPGECAGLVAGQRMDEIVPGRKRSDIHVDVQGCVFRMKNSGEAAAGRRGVKIKLAQLERIWSVAVAKDRLAGNRNVSRRGFVGFVPTHACGNIEVAEIV